MASMEVPAGQRVAAPAARVAVAKPALAGVAVQERHGGDDANRGSFAGRRPVIGDTPVTVKA